MDLKPCRAGRIRDCTAGPHPGSTQDPKWPLFRRPQLLHTGCPLGTCQAALASHPPTLCLSHPTLQDCTAPWPPPPLACPVILPAPGSALLPSLSSAPSLHLLCGNNLCDALERRKESKEAAQGPGGLAYHWLLFGALQSREAGPLVQGRLPVSWLLRDTMWAARPGQAWAGSGPLRQTGPLW